MPEPTVEPMMSETSVQMDTVWARFVRAESAVVINA